MIDVAKPAFKQELFTQVFVNGARFDPLSVALSEQTQCDNNPEQLDLVKSIDLLKSAYDYRHNPARDKMIILGMLDTIKAELPTSNLNYSRSIALGDVVLHYGVALRKAEPVVITLDETPAQQSSEGSGTVGKDLSAYLQEPAKPADELDLGALATIDFDAVNQRVHVMQEGGGEVVEPSNDCEGGGCKI